MPDFVTLAIQPGDYVELHTVAGEHVEFQVSHVDTQSISSPERRFLLSEINELYVRSSRRPDYPCGGEEVMGCSIPAGARLADAAVGVSTGVLFQVFSWHSFYGNTFYDACVQHDFCYRHGYKTYGHDKEHCDAEFYNRMLESCKSIDLTCGTAAKEFSWAVREHAQEGAFKEETSTECLYDGPVGWDETSVFVEPVEGPPLDVPAGTYSLNFDSLPSAQGWTFLKYGPAENDVYSIDGSRLTQRTFGSGTNGIARYQIEGVADPNKHMVLSLTARVLRHEALSGGSTGLGLNFYVSDGAFSHRLALTADRIQVGGQFYALNATVFHDYSFELNPGGNFNLYVDGVIFATGVGSETVSSNKIFFGDSTAHENANAEITAMSFTVGAN